MVIAGTYIITWGKLSKIDNKRNSNEAKVEHNGDNKGEKKKVGFRL